MIDLDKEQKLVEEAKHDLESFGALYDLYVKKVYSFVFHMVMNHSDTEDIVAETFERAMLHIGNFQYKGYTFGAWLFKIARNLVYDKSKSRKIVSIDELDEVITDNSSTPDKDAERFFEKNDLFTALNKLGADQKEIVYLRYIEQYSIREVCDMTGKSEDSIKSLAKRAISKLRDNLTLNK